LSFKIVEIIPNLVSIHFFSHDLVELFPRIQGLLEESHG
jgi:hypothetical protein